MFNKTAESFNYMLLNRFFGSQVKRRAYDQHGLGSKPTLAILLCPWERHFMTLYPAWWS